MSWVGFSSSLGAVEAGGPVRIACSVIIGHVRISAQWSSSSLFASLEARCGYRFRWLICFNPFDQGTKRVKLGEARAPPHWNMPGTMKSRANSATPWGLPIVSSTRS